MTHTLQFTDGVTTVIVTAGDMYLAAYAPQTPKGTAETIKERATVGFKRSNAAIRSNYNALNRLFVQAASYQRNGSGRKVYVEFDPGDTGDLYRSLLYSGSAQLQAEALGGMWGANNEEIDLEWERQPFWEGPRTQVPLSNSSSTDNTAGLVVNNRSDAAGENFADIYAADVEGDLPAPIELQMVNSDTDSTAARELYVFHNVYSSPFSFTHIVEGESATNSTDTVTSTTDSACSGYAYASIAFASTSETKIAEWTLTSTDLSNAKGGHFAVIARWAELFATTDTWLRLKLETATTYSDLWAGKISLVSETTDGAELTMLDTLWLPPYLQGQTTIKETALRLYGLHDSSASETIKLDYLMLAPISGDSGWLWFKSVDQGIPPDQTFVHDALEDMTYHKDAAGNFIAEFVQKGGPLLLAPGEDQRLYFLSCDANGYALPAQTWTVKLWYRPRRCAI